MCADARQLALALVFFQIFTLVKNFSQFNSHFFQKKFCDGNVHIKTIKQHKRSLVSRELCMRQAAECVENLKVYLF